MALSQRAVEAPRRDPARRELADAGIASERGFTLIEVLVAATLLILSVLATLSMVDRATATTAVSKQRDVANALAQDMIERASGGRYTASRNDLTDVDPAAALKGPADRLRATLDPDGDQSSSAITPATVTSGTVPVYVPQSWTLRRKNTQYTVSYRACTLSDAYQGVQILGPFDCTRPTTTDPTGPEGPTAGSCSVGVIPPAAVDPANPGQLTVRFQLVNALGVSACVGALSPNLSNALCTLLGTSPLLGSIKDSLLGSKGSLTSLLGGLRLGGASVGVCESAITETGLAGASDGIGTSTRLAVKVAWTDLDGRAHTIDQSALIRRGTA
jgi:type II secretory pathway pseudopilin PulG